jgi:ribosomal protein S18 acetylase RimI-like enzyme
MSIDADTEREADLDAIDLAFTEQWSVFGLGPRGEYHDEGDLVWIEAPIPQIPYNAIIRARLGADAGERITALVEHFRGLGYEFMCPVQPRSTPADLGDHLEAAGLSVVERATGMALDLSTRAGHPAPADEADGVVYREVTTDAGMDAYEELIAFYWELPEESLRYVRGINRWAGFAPDAPGRRWVASIDGRPVGKTFLRLQGLVDSAGIFGVSVKNEARGRGVATTLMDHVMHACARLGRTRMVLHSSEMAVNMYRRIGFVDRCEIPVYATTGLHTLQTS